MDVTATQLLEKDIENLARGEERGARGAGLWHPPDLSPRLEVFVFCAGVINSCD